MAKSGPTVQPKRPRRKYRRRPSRLYEEYQRRASQTCWLETHIWHAKRLTMEEVKILPFINLYTKYLDFI